MAGLSTIRRWFHWFGHFGGVGWRPPDLDAIPSYNRRHKKRLLTLLLASVVLLAVWVCAHQLVAPDIGARSLLFIGGMIIPHSLLVCFWISRLKPSWREYTAMYAMVVSYSPIQFLFSISRSDAAPYLLAGTCYLFLIVSNLMMRLRFGNALAASLYLTPTAVWLFARQGAGPTLILCFVICAIVMAASTLYVNRMIGNDEMYYMRQEQHLRLVLSGGRRDLWEFDPGRRVFKILPWDADPALPPVIYGYDEYLVRIHPDHRAGVTRAIDDSLAGVTQRFQLEFQMRLDGHTEWRWLQLAGHAGERTGARLIGTSSDVTDRKSLHAQVEQRTRECEQAAREKADFLATVSHSIRTPLDAVIGATSVLATDDVGGEIRGMVDVIQESGQLLLTVLNDVLDIGSSHQSLPQIEPAVFRPHQLLHRCCDLIRPLAMRKDLELNLVVSPLVLPALSGDAGRLQQVFINLLSNAVKFTSTGSVCLHATVEPSSDPASQSITFAVSDTGVGIEESARHSLFGRFEQLHPQTMGGPAGTGLGLAISQRLVAAMGGVIHCESTPGFGSTFFFTLQFPVPTPEEAVGGENASDLYLPPEAEAEQVRVLVAEDNPVNRRVLAGMLQRLNCEVHVVANGAEAVEACREGAFQVIFMDCDMPVVNGLEAARRIRQLPRFADVPIIAATAHALEGNLEACRKAGMSDALTKPVTLRRLTEALAQWTAPRQPAGEGRG